MKAKRDHHLRRRLFSAQSFEHKGRANLYFMAHLLERWSDKGLIVDPMGGAGSTLLALEYGHPILIGDIEAYWTKVQAENIRGIPKQSLLARSAPGLACQWDAARLPLARNSVGNIMFSPPYFDMLSDWNRKSGHALESGPVGPMGQCYGDHARQVGNVHIYKHFLDEMAAILRECWRVLWPGGKLVLIVGDRQKDGRKVPVMDDLRTLAEALDFSYFNTVER